MLDTPDAPSISILVPSEGATVCGNPTIVELEIAGATLASPLAERNVAVDPLAAESVSIEVKLDGADVALALDTHLELEGVGDGPHSLAVRLVDAYGQGVDPGAVDEVAFTTSQDACSSARAE